MSPARCADPLPFEVLVDYWLEPRPGEREGELEEHLFACAACSAELETVASLADGVRRVGLAARLRGSFVPAVLARLEQDRRVVRRYRAAAGGHIYCTAGAEDDFVVLELSADLAGIERVDLVYCAEDGTVLERARELPVVRERRVVWGETGEFLRELPSGISFVRLLAVEPGGERLIGEYTLHHTAFRA